jgi:hypothetical protein
VIPNAIAALLLYIRDQTGQLPHVYFDGPKEIQITYLLKFLAFGEGDTAQSPARCWVNPSTIR